LSIREDIFTVLDDCARRARCDRGVQAVLTMMATSPTGGITVQQAGQFEPLQFQAELLALMRKSEPMMGPLTDAMLGVMLGRVEGLCVLTAGPRGWEIRRAGKQAGLMVDQFRGAA